jgi:hypothetical protein
MTRRRKITGPKKKEFYEAANRLFSDLVAMNEHFAKLGLSAVGTLQEAFDSVLGMWINIVDFVGGRLKPFPSRNALVRYTIQTKRFFPLREAKSSGLSRLLVKMSF